MNKTNGQLIKWSEEIITWAIKVSCESDLKLGILSSILEKNTFLILESALQSSKKWFSSSILLLLQKEHILSLQGISSYLPVSVLSKDDRKLETHD